MVKKNNEFKIRLGNFEIIKSSRLETDAELVCIDNVKKQRTSYLTKIALCLLIFAITLVLAIIDTVYGLNLVDCAHTALSLLNKLMLLFN